MIDTGMKVWREACDASQHHPSPVLGHLAAAAVITAAMAQDKARIAELEEAIAKALNAPMIDHSGRGMGIYGILRKTLEARNVTDT